MTPSQWVALLLGAWGREGMLSYAGLGWAMAGFGQGRGSSIGREMHARTGCGVGFSRRLLAVHLNHPVTPTSLTMCHMNNLGIVAGPH